MIKLLKLFLHNNGPDMTTIDLSKPRYDQKTYWGRAQHFFAVTNPLNLLASDKQLDKAKEVVDTYNSTKKMPEGYNAEKLWAAKYLVDSAFHPDTGEKMMLIGRMSAQAPMNTLITGCMITFYKSNAATIFWQWTNQTFNAIVNYTNRSGTTPLSMKQLGASYVCACGGALTTALYLNSKAKKMKNPMYARLVPFAAVVAANFINIPMMRSNEIINGTPVYSGPNMIGNSARAAATGIGLVCVSRIVMATPGMIITPWLTNIATQRGLFCHRPMAVIPFQLALVAICVTFATPLACAIFEQQASFPVASLEPPLQEKMKKMFPKETSVVYNKGL